VTTSNLAVRLTTAGVVAPLLLLLLFAGPAWGWYLLVAAACGIAAQELFAMTHPGDKLAQAAGIASTLGISVCLYFFTGDTRVLVSIFLVVPMLGALVTLFRLGAIETAAPRVMAAIAGPFYIGALITTVALLRRDQGELGPRWVLMVLMFSWLADTGGYFVGRFFGKTKLHERVSPKKTVEGFLGSLGGASVGALLAHFWFLKPLPLEHALPLAIVAGGLGQLGDLVESLIKRSTGIKDSGWIVPGHGGLLDRIDALLVASPVVYLYTLWAFPVSG